MVYFAEAITQRSMSTMLLKNLETYKFSNVILIIMCSNNYQAKLNDLIVKHAGYECLKLSRRWELEVKKMVKCRAHQICS